MRYLKILILLLLFAPRVKAQGADLQQLILDIEKLTQLKSILSDMEQGYQLVSKGYNTVKQVADGNFSVHNIFLTGLMAVNPAVAKYGRIADIITSQANLIAECKAAKKRFGGMAEIGYLSAVYGSLLKSGLNDLDQLTMIVTAGQARMSDGERLAAIDRIADDSDDRLQCLRQFNRKAALLAAQRNKEQADINSLKSLY